MNNDKYDILIVGGGHAGVEAAWIASQFDIKVGIVTMEGVTLASAPCNPAIGGVGKGQVVRELDVLGGLMPRLADASAIQCRVLNESKGFAVQSTRFQIDKQLYTDNAENIIKNSSIDVLRGTVLKIEKTDLGFNLNTSLGSIGAAKLVVTTGTFLDGKLHTGSEQADGGRVDCDKSNSLSDLFSSVKTAGNRFKTGTPPRLDIKTIDFSKLEEQPSDPNAINFSILNKPYERRVSQISCHLGRTNEKTLGIIRSNKEQSPIFNGQIKGVGPRYCPSIEDKAFRYEDRNSHHVFVEPEGLSLDTVYPNGVSTSLPKEVQKDFIQTIPGLENAEIKVFGYAVEYDVVDTALLDETLQYIEISGLYFAGQVNGTSGYEEAAGQGYIAGVNAALSFLGREPLVLDRSESYIGVMIDDLITSTRDEPYRLFTARTENRLFIREDNTFIRLYKYRKFLNLNEEIDNVLRGTNFEAEVLSDLVSSHQYIANDQTKKYFIQKNYGQLEANTSLKELLKRANLNPVEVLKEELREFKLLFSEIVIRTIAIDAKYDGYIKRSDKQNDKMKKLNRRPINWEQITETPNISFECRQRIMKIRPKTFGQLSNIEGIRPATLAYVAGTI